MRVVLQLVKEAEVVIEKQVFSKIGKGFLLLVGFEEHDDYTTACKMIDKVLSLRLFPDSMGKTNLSLDDINGEIMYISQFTLYGDIKKGRRPSFVKAMNSDEARDLYLKSLAYLKEKFKGSIAQGIFQEDMEVSLVNDGPFTLMIDSEEL